MALIGADIDELYNHAARLENLASRARQMEGEVRSAASGLMTIWTGPDAEAHRMQLAEQADALGAVTMAMRAAAQSIKHTADVQRATSSW